jgi:galactokinase
LTVFNKKERRISTPGRICLFGEHQDYLGLPVIPMAIDLRLQIEGNNRKDQDINLNLLDLKKQFNFSVEDERRPCKSEDDFLHSAIGTLIDHGFELSGIDAKVWSRIPINSGTSSSTAFITAWIAFMLEISDQKFVPQRIALLAYESEVLAFDGPGGMMDQIAIAHGGINMVHFEPELSVDKIDVNLGTFVLGDSLEPKDTYGGLRSLREPLFEVKKKIESIGSDYRKISIDEARSLTQNDPEIQKLVVATLENRDITIEAQELLSSENFDPFEIGKLLDQHHKILANELNRSTPKIDAMLMEARKAGAYGGKINGSGGGGAMFAYAPENPEKVAEAIEKAGGKSYIIRVDGGVRIEDLAGEKNV